MHIGFRALYSPYPGITYPDTMPWDVPRPHVFHAANIELGYIVLFAITRRTELCVPITYETLSQMITLCMHFALHPNLAGFS